ncbi:MAG: aspartate aminotransferase family protein [Rhodospirillales bacterium]|jgi:4-aminobutyrate---pyruvate transaminase|nr:aspartate aminotransferase family protein [Rhodospirillales bacterium]MBT4038609.1 aspartate aminotransferase family protein [Rhodospirillales bacterium]MBT4627631.1 aspartate aminotransferase family protein [Rhodospirillales bacterium]MBT5351550.1 aspartate aminotransferase family protein [Rhodospirillales bacterium]MBT5521524.1 aspartate aminotransferase family protein [Rhodospirillales bacterium]
MAQVGNSAASRDIAYHVHGYTNLKKHEDVGPFIIKRAEGVRVYDENGKGYIEGLAGLWCTGLGYGEERLIEAATNAMRNLSYCHGFAHMAADTVIDLSEKLVGVAPDGISKVLYANSGSEATDLAVKLIWYYHNAIGKPEKKKIISRIKAYHGVTVAAASMTGLPHLHADFDLPIDRIKHTDCPHYYRFGLEGESEEDFATRCAANLEQMILDEGPDTVAAFIAEPIMGAGGVLVPPATYFEKIQAVLKKYDVLLVADEVINGFGRTGNMWGSQTFGLKPDLVSCAKQLSSAYLPISALMISDKVYQALVSESEKLGLFGHGSTYGGHPVSAAVALETLNIYEERDILGHARRISPALQNGMRRFADHELVGEVRGVGLIGAIELVANKETKESFDPKAMVGAYAVGRAREHGLISRPIADSIAFCPPMIVTEDEIEEMMVSFGKALDDTTVWAKSEGLLS